MEIQLSSIGSFLEKLKTFRESFAFRCSLLCTVKSWDLPLSSPVFGRRKKCIITRSNSTLEKPFHFLLVMTLKIFECSDVSSGKQEYSSLIVIQKNIGRLPSSFFFKLGNSRKV